MTTREEIEAAARRYAEADYVKQKDDIGAWDEYWRPIQKDSDMYLLADAYIAERSERQRRIEAAASEIRHLQMEQGFITRLQVEQIITHNLNGETT